MYCETHKERAFHGVASAAANAPSAEEEGAGDGDTNENGVDVADLGKGCDSPQEINRTRDDRGGSDEKADLQKHG